jgi:hypothetical protein
MGYRKCGRRGLQVNGELGLQGPPLLLYETRQTGKSINIPFRKMFPRSPCKLEGILVFQMPR